MEPVKFEKETLKADSLPERRCNKCGFETERSFIQVSIPGLENYYCQRCFALWLKENIGVLERQSVYRYLKCPKCIYRLRTEPGFHEDGGTCPKCQVPLLLEQKGNENAD